MGRDADTIHLNLRARGRSDQRVKAKWN